MNSQISVRDFFTKNQFFSFELEKLKDKNDEIFIKNSKIFDLILEYIQIKSENPEIIKWKCMTLIYYSKIIKKIIYKTNESKQICFYQKLQDKDYYNEFNLNEYKDYLLSIYQNNSEKNIIYDIKNSSFKTNSSSNFSNSLLINDNENEQNKNVLPNKITFNYEKKKESKLFPNDYKLLTFNELIENKSEKKILELLNLIKQSKTIKHFIINTIKNSPENIYSCVQNLNLKELNSHFQNIYLTLISFFIPFYSFNQKTCILNKLKTLFPVTILNDISNNIINFKNTNTLKSILYNIIKEKNEELKNYNFYFSNYQIESDLIEKYQLILIFEIFHFNKISNNQLFILKIAFSLFITLKSLKYIQSLKNNLRNIIYNIMCIKEFYLYYNKPLNELITFNKEDNTFSFLKMNFNKKEIDINNYKIEYLFPKKHIKLFNQTLISISNFYNLEKEKRLFLITEKIQQVPFGSHILHLKYIKDLVINKNPQKYKNNLITLEKNILKLVKENYIFFNYEISEFFIPSQIKDIYEDFVTELKYNFYKYDYKLYPYGSVTEFLSSKTSDLDIYLDINNIIWEEKLTFLSKLLKFLENKCEKVKTIISTRICVISFTYKFRKDNKKVLKMDLNLSGFCPYLHSCLIRSYSLIDARFPILSLCIKKILKIVKLINKDYEQIYLNTFSWMLLLITFLQDIIQPPILPKLLSDSENQFVNSYIKYGNNLKEKKTDDIKNFESYLNNVYPETIKIPINNFDIYKKIYYKRIPTNNKLSVSELLLKFLEFIIFYLKYDTIYLNCSLNKEGFENISSLIFNTNKDDYSFKDYFIRKFKASSNGLSRDGVFLIRDPFDSNYNPGHTFKFTSLDSFISNLEIAYFTLIKTGSFEEIEFNILNKK